MAAIALCGGLALGACGSGQAGGVGAASPGSPSAAPSATPSNAPSGYAEHYDAKGLPAQWQGSAGWNLPSSVQAKDVVGLGSAVAYLAPKQGSDKVGHVTAVDASGAVVYTAPEPTDMDSPSASLYGVVKGGKAYAVYAVEGTAKQDPSSVAKPGAVTAVTVLGEGGKVVTSAVLPGVGSLEYYRGLVTVSGVGDDTGSPKQEFDPLAGKVVPLGSPAGFRFVGTSDGNKLWVRDDAKDNAGEITNGKWSLPAAMDVSISPSMYRPAATTPDPVIFGKYFEIKLRQDNYLGEDICAVYDSSTGAKVAMGPLEGKCFTADVTSPDGGIIAADVKNKLGGDVSSSVYSIADGKSFAITPAINFTPQMITDQGEVYANSGSGIALLDLRSGKDPQVLSGVSSLPKRVTDGGFGIFDSFVLAPKH